MGRENKPNVSIRTICCYLASAFFDDAPFTGNQLVHWITYANVWRETAPNIPPHKNDVYIVSKAPCVSNVRSYLSEEASFSNGMLTRLDNGYKCNMQAVERVKAANSFPDQAVWRRHVGYTLPEKTTAEEETATATTASESNETNETSEIIRAIRDMRHHLDILIAEEQDLVAAVEEHVETMTALLHTNVLENLPRVTEEAEQVMLKGQRQDFIKQRCNEIKSTLQRIAQSASI